MKKLVLTVLVLYSIIACNNERGKFDSAIGKKFIDISEISTFNGFKENQSALLEPLNNVNYGVSVISKNDSVIILFEKLHSIEYINKFEILDILEIGKIKDAEIICCQTCRRDSILDSEIIAIAKYDENQEQFTRILKAWKADRVTGKLRTIEIKGITCMNECYGAD